MLKEIYHFFLHLRLHYQILILSGGYLLGGFLAGEMNTTQYWVQFFNVHVLLFGGATAYNSWWDKDTGPIGGLKNPPKMNRWMHPVSLLLMFIGLWFALSIGWGYSTLFFISLILFWLYSTPHARWKSRPLLSLVAISISTGFNSVLMGTLAAGSAIAPNVVVSAVGASLILLSLYPVSQIFQLDEDKRRQDRTFVLAYGVNGMKKFFLSSFTIGAMLLGISVFIYDTTAGAILLTAIAICGTVIASLVMRLKGISEEYSLVMKTKFLASLSFVAFFLAGNILRHGWFS